MKKLYIRTFGCQMNEYDSDKMADVLGAADGLEKTDNPEEADVILFNTCSVREKAQEKVFHDLGRVKHLKQLNPDLIIGVGGCVASQEGEAIVARAPYVDLVFGPQTLHRLPKLIAERKASGRSQVDISFPEIEKFDNLPPARTEGASAFVSIMEGCSKYCTFCIVPYTRGDEVYRPLADVLAEVAGLAAQGVKEVTLLGQNVNTYGVEFGDKGAFAKLLRACGEIDGLERVRFTSPHPAAFTDDVIEAMAQTPNVMPQLHMPLQSGSDRVLKAMRRSYRSEKFLGILDKVRAQIPDAAITTDLIVGFPGETEEDFAQTLRVVEASRFSSAFTFQYSIRPGTPAATMEGQVPKAVVQERFERLIALQEDVSWAENRRFEGREVEVLVAPFEGRKDGETARMSGRAQDNRLVHFSVPDGGERPRAGDLVTVGVTYGAPHHLVADGALEGGRYAVRRTPGGDAWERLQTAAVPGKPAVSLGMPSVGAPAPSSVPSGAACASS